MTRAPLHKVQHLGYRTGEALYSNICAQEFHSTYKTKNQMYDPNHTLCLILRAAHLSHKLQE